MVATFQDIAHLMAIAYGPWGLGLCVGLILASGMTTVTQGSLVPQLEGVLLAGVVGIVPSWHARMTAYESAAIVLFVLVWIVSYFLRNGRHMLDCLAWEILGRQPTR